MSRLAMIGGYVAFCCSTLIAADPNTDVKQPVTQPTVAELVKQLGADSYQARTQAWKKLEQLTTDSLPELQEALKQTQDAEVKRRLELLIPNLERFAALSPTRLSLTIQNKPVRDAIQEIAKKTGYRLELAAGNDKEKELVSFDFQNAAFWDVLDHVCEHCGVAYQEGWYGYDNDGIRLEFARTLPGITSTDGPFRVSVRRFHYNKQVDFTHRIRVQPAVPQPQPPAPPGGLPPDSTLQARKTETLSLELGVGVEPKLPLLSASQPILLEAVDEQGRSMVIPTTNVQTGMRYYYGGYRSFLQQVQVQLQPTDGARQLKSLKGTIPVTLVSSQRPIIVVDKILDVKDKSFKEGNVQMKIEHVAKNGQQVAIKMTMSETAKDNTRDWNWINSLQQRLVLEDANGKKYQCYGPNFEGNNFNGKDFVGTMTYNNNNQAGEAVRLIYYEWQTINHSVPFEFKDLTLP